MNRKGFLNDIHLDSPLTNARESFKKNEPEITVQIVKSFYNRVRKIAFLKHSSISDITNAIISYGFPIYDNK